MRRSKALAAVLEAAAGHQVAPARRDRARRRFRRVARVPRRALPLSLLLDTHAPWWLLAGDPRVYGARAAIEEARAPVLVSGVCVWEAAVKRATIASAEPIFDAYSIARVW
jgi:hypothetical protein